MAEYINRDDLLKAAWDKPTLSLSVYDIGNIKPVDVDPVRHARWDDEHKCTVCHNEAFCKISNIRPDYDYDWEENLVETGDYIWDIEWVETDYCPNCGCKMDLEV